MTPVRAIPRVSPQARRYVAEMLDFGFHNGRSPGFSARLEQQFAARFGRNYGILHSNGTTTMHAALLAAEVGPGDEVIVPPYTMFSTAAVALHAGAVPVLADVDPETWTISPQAVEQCATPRTKAIIPVSICGLSPDMDPIMAIARRHRAVVIEDNAQCFLGSYHGRLVGSIGDFASFSFQASKHMTCGDGGILLCDDEQLATRVRQAAVLGYSTLSARPGDSVVAEELRCHPSFARHTRLGYNFRMPEIAAAVALAEFERLDELVAMRIAAARCLDEVVRGCEWLVPQRTPEGYVHTYWTYTVRIARDDIDWAALRRKFVELGGDGFYGAYLPTHREPVMAWLGEEVRRRPDHWPQFAGRLPDYTRVCCPVWDSIQPRIIQFKTNYFDLAEAERQAEILERTIRFFS